MAYTSGTNLTAKSTYTTGTVFPESAPPVTGSTITAPITVSVVTPLQKINPITVSVVQPLQKNNPITVAVVTPLRVSAPVLVNTSEPSQVVTKIQLSVSHIGNLQAPITVSVASVGKQIKHPVTVATHKQGQLQNPIKLVTSVLPLGVVTEQGLGHKITPNTNQTRKWSASVVVGGVDITQHVIEDINIGIEINAARVATFSFLLDIAVIDINAYAAKPVTITYREYDPITGLQTTESVIFSGIVDTPSFDLSTGVLSLTCTDAIQKQVMSLPVEKITELTPKAYWSPYVYQEYNNRWEYLLQTIETYPYMFYMDSNKTLTVVEEQVTAIKYQFERNSIIDGSLKVDLASSRNIVNYIDVSFTYSKDEYREQIINLNWEGNPFIPTASACGAGMIVDAISEAGGSIVGNPVFSIQPKTRMVEQGGYTSVVVNQGDELIAVGCSIKVAKRYTQNVSNTFKTVVKSDTSIADVGILSATEEVTLSAEYLPDATKWFTETATKTQYWCTANNGYNLGVEKPEQVSNRPYRPASDGGRYFEPYPAQSLEFPVWATDKGLTPLDLKTRSKRLKEPYGSVSGEAINAFSVENYSAPYAVGEHVYNLDHVIVHGTSAEAEIAYKTVIARAKTSILRSHKQNAVSFESSIKPFVNLGDTIRVSTPRIVATGVVTRLDHVLSVGQGSATSALTMNCSTSKPFKSYNEAPATQQLVAPIIVAVGTDLIATQPASPQNTRQLLAYGTSAPQTIHYDSFYGNHYYKQVDEIQQGWLGHISPRTGYPGDNQFRVHFPEIPFTQVNSWTTAVNAGTIDVQVLEDEFILRSI